MSASRLLIDNDIFLLLSGSGLLDKAIHTFGFKRPNVCHLGTLPYIMRDPQVLPTLPDTVKQAITQECSRIPVLQEQPNAQIQQRLAAVREIDPGEAVLFSLLAERPSYLMITGDKRAIRVLNNAQHVREIRNAIAGRVICFEAVCLELIFALGVPLVAQAFAPFIPVYKTLAVCFSPGCIERPEECKTALLGYFRQLQREVSPNFLWSRAW